MFKLIRTDEFEQDLDGIVSYLNDNFSNQICLEYLYFLKEQLKTLSYFPYTGIVAINGNYQNLRTLISRKNYIFYSVDEEKEEITLKAIVPMYKNNQI